MSDFTRKLTIFSCLLFTGFCFWKAALGLVDVTDASVVSTAEAAVRPAPSHKRGITTPIQDMRPGMRIVGRNPIRIQTESTVDPTPEGWRLLSVRMLKQDGSYFEAELLRPLSWISRHRAQPGATIQLNMPELHVVGAAEVLSISDCPPIDPGDGPVVISTFKNVSNNVLNIYVEGEETPIGVTAGHPIWSEDRQAFIHSEKLQIGEKLRSALGRTVRITSIEPRAGPEAVYNLEVAGEHVYSVADSGLLVHNVSDCDLVTKITGLDGRVFDINDFPRANVNPSKKLNGRKIINSDLAGTTRQTTGGPVQFDADGFPVFTPYSLKTVRVDGLTGKMADDIPAAMRAANMDLYDDVLYVWHHHQDTKTMMLVPRSVHSVRNGGVGHTGGRAVIKHNLANPNNSINYLSPSEF